MNKAAYFKIGVLAQKTSVAVSSLRYYRVLGLLQPVYRGNNGYRYYSQNACQQVEFLAA